MAPRLEEPERSRALSEAVSATRAIADEQALPRALSELAPRLEEPERSRALSEALAAARAIGDERARRGR